MYVHDQTSPAPTALPGIAHATWAGIAENVGLSLWRQTVAPGAGTPPHRHDCDEVVLCTAGYGELHIAGQVQRFGPDQTLTLPRGVEHQFFNVGALPLEVLGIFAASPVGTFLPDGQAIDLPWRS
ncbi:MAG TPA: cupin domain-containing protein [Thermomonas sp.]|nr:cupin domain-containing protein [Thermomonas sp.]